MNDRFINPGYKNPLYKGAMTLDDAKAGVQFFTYQMSTGQIWITALASDWREESFVNMFTFTHEARTPVANDTLGQIINLAAWGICPDSRGRWSEDCFSVVATKENVTSFHAYAERQKLESVVRIVEEAFIELFIDWDSFMNDLLK